MKSARYYRAIHEKSMNDLAESSGIATMVTTKNPLVTYKYMIHLNGECVIPHGPKLHYAETMQGEDTDSGDR